MSSLSVDGEFAKGDSLDVSIGGLRELDKSDKQSGG